MKKSIEIDGSGWDVVDCNSGEGIKWKRDSLGGMYDMTDGNRKDKEMMD